MAITFGKETFIVCRNSQGSDVRANTLRISRYLVVFEVYNPYSILQLSEVLNDFKILIGDRLVYSGRAVVSNLVNTGILLVCEATLEDGWLDVDLFSSLFVKDKIRNEFFEFVKEWEKAQKLLPEFKVVVADLLTSLMDLRRWLEQVELGIRSETGRDRVQSEQEVIQELRDPLFPAVSSLFNRFEEISAKLPEDQQNIHRAYGRRQIHPIILCSPFVYRVYQKPLGYAGDYEMVNMILRDPMEGSSLFAKILNCHFLSQAPCEAHRNRVKYLGEKLREETLRVTRLGRPLEAFNLGCGPAGEVQNFLAQDDLCDRARLTLLDFNPETLNHTTQVLENIKAKNRRATDIKFIQKSVNQILKEATKERTEPSEEKYDFIYCAGLFDYLSDRICLRLMDYFYDHLAPGGLLTATNVDPSNPIRFGMECFLEWHLVYRNSTDILRLKPTAAPDGECRVLTDATGVNVFLEIRKPHNA